MEINLVALIITLASFIFGFILGVAIGKFDDNFGGYN
jgi:ABC-type dipeptide/oligopeptide/nickel transport system permease subunit